MTKANNCTLLKRKERIASVFPWLLMNDSCVNVRVVAATSKFAGDRIHTRLAHDKKWKVREKVAVYTKNPMILAFLANDSNANVRAAVAHNEHTEKETLDVLAKDNYLIVLEGVISNENTDPDILDFFATKTDSFFDIAKEYSKYSKSREESENCQNMSMYFCICIASNCNIKRETFERLMKHPNPMVRHESLYNPKLTSVDAEKLMNDSDPSVRLKAKEMFEYLNR